MAGYRRPHWVVEALLVAAVIYAIVWIVIGLAEYGARRQTGWGITSAPGPVTTGPATPTPNIEEHVAAVMGQGCPPCPECPTWDALKRAGVEVVCGNAFGAVPTTNYWHADVPMACSRVRKVIITDKQIVVERR